MGSPRSHPTKHYWSNQDFWVRFVNYAFNTKGSPQSKTTGPTSMAGPPGHLKARLSTRYTTGPTSMAVYAARRFYPGLHHRIPSKQDYSAHFSGCVVNHIGLSCLMDSATLVCHVVCTLFSSAHPTIEVAYVALPCALHDRESGMYCIIPPLNH